MLQGVGRVTVLVEDQQAALDWYRAVLGFEVIHDEEDAGYRYLHIGVPGQAGMGVWLMAAAGDSRQRVGRQTAGEPLLVCFTGDLDAVRRHLDEHGVEVWNVQEGAGGRSLHLRDVAGNVLVVAELADTTSA